MTKKLVVALVLLGLTVVVLLFNSRGSVGVNLILGSVDGIKSLVFLGFTAIGVVIGVLLK